MVEPLLKHELLLVEELLATVNLAPLPHEAAGLQLLLNGDGVVGPMETELLIVEEHLLPQLRLREVIKHADGDLGVVMLITGGALGIRWVVTDLEVGHLEPIV